MKIFWFYISRFLRHSRLCLFINIKCGNIIINFFPTSLSTTLWLYPDYSRVDIKNIRDNLKTNDTFVDVGANIGQLTLEAWNKVGLKGNVIAIEGNKKIFNYLTKNASLNNAKIELLNVIVGQKSGYAGIQNKKADDMNQVIENGKIQMKTLDEICNYLPKIDLLKIDVEGYELEVLKGSKKTLKKTNKILLEILETLANNFESTSKDIHEFLKKRNFRLLKDLGNGNFLFVKKKVKHDKNN